MEGIGIYTKYARYTKKLFGKAKKNHYLTLLDLASTVDDIKFKIFFSNL